MKKDVCIFINYDPVKIHFYVSFYIKELVKYFDEILFVTNLQSVNNDFIKNNKKIKVITFKNEAYDFGLFYKALNSINIEDYKKIAFINDSNILFGKLDKIFEWGNNSNLDVWGLTDSVEGVPNYRMHDTHHIQSYFLIFENKAINHLMKFFDEINFEKFFINTYEERDLRLKIISQCEMGITPYMKRKGLKVDSMFKVHSFSPKYTKVPISAVNMHFKLWKELIQNGYPFIKKKIILNDPDLIREGDPKFFDFTNWRTVVKNNMTENEDIFKKLITI